MRIFLPLLLHESVRNQWNFAPADLFAVMPVRYVGVQSTLRGKYVFEILRNLRNFGIGRILVRSTEEKYPEPCYYIVRGVNPKMDPEGKLGTMEAEHVFRGRSLGVQTVDKCDVPDWRLLPREEEEAYKNFVKPTIASLRPKKIVPAASPFPPLLRMVHLDELRKAGRPADQEPMIPLEIERSVLFRPIQEGVEVPLGSAAKQGDMPHNTLLPDSVAPKLYLHNVLAKKK